MIYINLVGYVFICVRNDQVTHEHFSRKLNIVIIANRNVYYTKLLNNMAGRPSLRLKIRAIASAIYNHINTYVHV